jgi:hypothetical protein
MPITNVPSEAMVVNIKGTASLLFTAHRAASGTKRPLNEPTKDVRDDKRKGNTVYTSLMFVPCIARRSINNQHYALNCTTPLFNIQAHTCFGSSLPTSGSFLDPSELLEMQIK